MPLTCQFYNAISWNLCMHLTLLICNKSYSTFKIEFSKIIRNMAIEFIDCMLEYWLLFLINSYIHNLHHWREMPLLVGSTIGPWPNYVYFNYNSMYTTTKKDVDYIESYSLFLFLYRVVAIKSYWRFLYFYSITLRSQVNTWCLGAKLYMTRCTCTTTNMVPTQSFWHYRCIIFLLLLI